MWELILKGGPLMVPLFFCSIIAWGVIFERYWSLRKVVHGASGLLQRLKELFQSRDTNAAQELVDSAPGPAASILSTGLRRYRLLSRLGRPPDDIEEAVRRAMEDHSAQVVGSLEKYLILLATVANVAPLLGFTGTVTGMIRAFNDIAAASAMDVKIVANGISEALITTAAGLIIAIPAFVAYNYYTNKIEKLVLAVEGNAAHFMEILAEGGND